MQDVYKNIEKCNPGKKCKILLVLDDMIADIHNNKKFNSTVIDLFIRCRNLSNYLLDVEILTRSRVLKSQKYYENPKQTRT